MTRCKRCRSVITPNNGRYPRRGPWLDDVDWSVCDWTYAPHDPAPEEPDPNALTFTCPVCRRTSHNPNDRRYGYCGNCHAFTGASDPAVQPPTPKDTLDT